MKVVIQRVINSSVLIDNKDKEEIDEGLMVLVGYTNNDSIKNIEYIVKKTVNLRIFEENNKMNLSGVPADERSMHNPRIPSHSNLFFPALLCELATYNESNSIRHSLSANFENIHKIDAYYEDFFL